MAWGMQGAGLGARHVLDAWEQKEKIKELLTKLRDKQQTRKQAYRLFVDNPIPGLGPAYFTKLIYFFCDASDRYIMDQWTGKSVNLLCGRQIVRIDLDAVSRRNDELDYEAFCRVIDHMAVMRRCSGDDLEQGLFSTNAAGRQKRGTWRQHVLDVWEASRPNDDHTRPEVYEWVDTLVQDDESDVPEQKAA
jgi:hypothetical protein